MTFSNSQAYINLANIEKAIRELELLHPSTRRNIRLLLAESSFFPIDICLRVEYKEIEYLIMAESTFARISLAAQQQAGLLTSPPASSNILLSVMGIPVVKDPALFQKIFHHLAQREALESKIKHLDAAIELEYPKIQRY